ncbi:hypothetical protein ARAM_001022 [Aspergillus rambellii]|uniref:Uncharacterized protein n=1 Tax=Aspergillus rambellii TaxID=308745 RepID=A0A0F8XAC7_9EURO|nr:hypothetical protein ARAM_001022 [Aspergillus rambellii]
MPKASPAYLLGGASLLSTFIVTILDGVCYATSRASVPNTSTVEAVIVSLSTLSCVVLLVMVLLWMNDLKVDSRVQQKPWRRCTYGTAIGYLSLATGITAAGIAWSAVQSLSGASGSESESRKSSATSNRQSVLIARCVLWAISVLSQGTLSGYLLTRTRKDNPSQWPTLISHELDAIILPNPSGTIHQVEAAKTPSQTTESQRPSIDPKDDRLPPIQPSASRTASQGSNRFSDRTLFHQDSKPNSIDLNLTKTTTLVSYPDSVTTRSKPDPYPDDPDLESAADPLSRTQQLHRSNSDLKRSLDSVLLRPLSSALSSPIPSSSSSSPTQIDAIAKRPLPKLNLPDESNIHPLFRSDSRSPPPTPTPGTIVVASPAAGQTISVKALNRMRSTRSVGAHTPRSRSPLFERVDQSETTENAPHLSSSTSSSTPTSSTPASASASASASTSSISIPITQ